MIEIRKTDKTKIAYDMLYNEKGIRQRDSFYIWIVNLIKPNRGKRLLDISCGEGKLIQIAQNEGLFSIGIDFSESAIKKGSKEIPLAKWAVADAEHLPFPDNSFDYITNIGSLEHYENPYRGASEIARVLHPGGCAVILLPNTYSLFGNIMYALYTGDVFDDGQPLQRYNTLIGWKNILEENGLSVQKMFKYEIERPRTLKDLLWIIRHPQKIIRLFISLVLPTSLANCFVYICTKQT
jgi:SAM-dependent methyltransferase